MSGAVPRRQYASQKPSGRSRGAAHKVCAARRGTASVGGNIGLPPCLHAFYRRCPPSRIWPSTGPTSAARRWPGSRSYTRSTPSGSGLARTAGGCCGTRLPQNNAIAYSQLLNMSWSHAQLQLTRNLGQELYLDSILMGGVNGRRTCRSRSIAPSKPKSPCTCPAVSSTSAVETPLGPAEGNKMNRAFFHLGLFSGLCLPALGCGGGEPVLRRSPRSNRSRILRPNSVRRSRPWPTGC